MTISEIIDGITEETSVQQLIPMLVEVANTMDEMTSSIEELNTTIATRDDEIASLKETNFDLMKKVFDKPVVEKKDEVEEEYVSDADIFAEM